MATAENLTLSSRGFLSAVRSGQVDVVRKILSGDSGDSRRHDINVQNDWGDTALLIASQLGYLTICQMLLAGGACSAKQNNRGETCLHRACVTGNIKIVEAILDKGAEKVINKVDDEGLAALHLAVQLKPASKAMDLAKILVQAGADVYIINNLGETSAAVARRCGNIDLACYLETKNSEEDNTIQEMNCYKDVIVSGYKEALNTVYYLITQARLMLIGNSGSGKTCLKRTLFGEVYDPEEPPTKGINADPSTAKIAFKQFRDWVLQPTSKVEVHRLNLVYTDLIINHILIKIRNMDVRKPPQAHVPLTRDKRVYFRDRESVHLMTGMSFDDRSLFSPVSSLALSSSQALTRNVLKRSMSLSTSQALSEEGSRTFSPSFVDMPSPPVSHVEESPIAASNSPPVDSDDSFKSTFSADLSQLPQEVLRRLLSRWNVTEHPKYLDSRYTSLSVCDTSGHPFMINVTPLFFSFRDIFLSIFDLSKSFDAPSQPHIEAALTDVYGHIPCNAEVLDEWLSVAAAQTKRLPLEPLSANHARCPRLPPIILIGSQVDKCESNCELTKVSEFINCRCFVYHMSQHNPPTIFCCSSLMESQSEYGENVSMPHAGHHLLRREIDTLARIMPYSHEKIPLKWLKFQQIICSLKEQEKCLLLYEELSGFLKTQCPGQFTNVEIHIMFTHYHSLGSICYYAAHKQLSQLVITDPNWLMNAAASVIKPPTRQWYTQAVKEEFVQLAQEGIVEISVMQLPYRYFHLPAQLWNRFVFIMDCLELFCLHPLLDKKQMMVPCVVIDPPPVFLTSSSHTPQGVSLCFRAEASAFPEILFYQVVSCSVRSATRYLPILYRHLAHIQLTKSYHLVLMKIKGQLLVKVEPTCGVCIEQAAVVADEPCYPQWEEDEFIQPETLSQMKRKPISKHRLVFELDKLENMCPTILEFLQYNIDYLCKCWMPGLVYNVELLVNNCYISLDNAYTTEQKRRPSEMSVWLP